MEDPRYPTGRFRVDPNPTPDKRAGWIRQIAEALLRSARLAGLDAQQLDSPYRPGGWTVRQVLHHVPDSH
jgi:hypothetical protein